jgi:hypothetical protein
VKTLPLNALATLRDDAAGPDGVGVEGDIEGKGRGVNPPEGPLRATKATAARVFTVSLVALKGGETRRTDRKPL